MEQAPVKKFIILRHIYLYFVAAVTIIMMISSIIGLLRIVLNEYVFHVKTYEQLEKPANFGECSDDQLFYVYDQKGVKLLKDSSYTKETMKKIKDECIATGIANRQEQHDNNLKQDIVFWLSMLVVAFPFYYLHWRIIKREK